MSVYDDFGPDEWRDERPPVTEREACARDGHAYFGNDENCRDGMKHAATEPCRCGRCYCGERRYSRTGAPVSRPGHVHGSPGLPPGLGGQKRFETVDMGEGPQCAFLDCPNPTDLP